MNPQDSLLKDILLKDIESEIRKAMCCPDSECLRPEDCWRDKSSIRESKQLIAIMSVIDAVLECACDTHLQLLDEEITTDG